MTDLKEGEGGRAELKGEEKMPKTASALGDTGVGSTDKADNVQAKPVDGPSFEPGMLEAYRASGAELIPLHGPDDKGPKGQPLGKAPMRKGWGTLPPLDVDEATEHMAAGRNVGVRLGTTDLVVDIDPRNFEEGDPVASLQKDLGFDLDDYPTVETGSGGKHVYMTLPEPMKTVETLDAYPGIEFKTHGRQVVAAGSVHPDTKRAYRWSDDPLAVPLGEGAPVAPKSLFEAIERPASGASTGGGDVGPEQLADMLEGLEVTDFRDHSKWLELMMASHHATGGDGREEFVAWSVGDPNYRDDAPIIGRRWDSLHADNGGVRVTQATLFKALHEVGKGELIPRPTAEDDFAEVEVDEHPIEGTKAEVVEARRQLVDDWVYLVRQEQYLSRSNCEAWSERQFRSLHQPLWKPTESIHEAVVKGKLPIRKVKAPRYEPGVGEFLKGGDYNVWRDTSVEPVRNDGLAQAFLDHLAYLLPDEKERGYLLDCLSFSASLKPVKANFVPLLFGPVQGTGKTYVAQVMARMIGKQNVAQVESDDLKKEYTGWAENKQFGVIEELMDTGKIEIANRLKTTITNEDIRIRRMYTDAYTVPNRLNLLAFSNHPDALRLENTDRRWLVLRSPAERRDDGYYKRLFDLLKDDAYIAAVRWELVNREVGLNPKGSAPETQAKLDMKAAGRNEPTQYLYDLLEEREGPLAHDLVRFDDLWNHMRSVFGSMRGLRPTVIAWLNEVGAQQHDGYTGKDRPRYRLWSMRDHGRYADLGRAGRIDAWLEVEEGSNEG